jgi:hypothetical protein
MKSQASQWLLVRFKNHWFNVIDLGEILRQEEHLCPYDDLKLRWLYPSSPQKLYLSRYRQVLQDLNYDMWLGEMLSNFEAIFQSCHCHKDFPDESRVHNHVVTGKLENIMKDELILDRLY